MALSRNLESLRNSLTISNFSLERKESTVNTIAFVSAKSRRILHFSPTVGGSMNDPALTSKYSTDWMKELALENERGLGDSIFEKMGDLPIDRVPEKSAAGYKEFCGARFIVENVIAELRDWKVLKYPIRSSLRNPEKITERYNKLCYIRRTG